MRLRILGSLALAVLLWGSPAEAACSNTDLGNGVICVQSGYTFNSTGGNKTFTFAADVTAGNFLACTVGQSQSTGISATVTDGDSQTWTANRNQNDGVFGNARVTVFTFENTAALSGATERTVTATWSATVNNGQNAGLACAEFSGITTSSAFDKTASQQQTAPGTGTDGITSGATATTAQATELLLGSGWSYVSSAGSVTAGTSYTALEINDTSDGNNHWLILEGRTVASTGTYAATATSSVDTGSMMIICTYKIAAAGGATQPASRNGLLGAGR